MRQICIASVGTALVAAAGLSAAPADTVNAEARSPIAHTVPEWTWEWDEQAETGTFWVPMRYEDRRDAGWEGREREGDEEQIELHYQLRIPEDREAIEGVIVLVPGLDQHSGRYRHFVDHFSDRFILASCDTRFMGRSNPLLTDLEPGEIPSRHAHRPLGNIRNFYFIVYDLDEFLHEILPRRLAGEGIDFLREPLIIVGHSLGGLVTIDYLIGNDYNRPPENLVGTILSAPALRPPREELSLFQRATLNYNYNVNATFGIDTEQRTLFLFLYEQVRNIVMTPIFYGISLTRIPIDSRWVGAWVTDDPWEQIGFQTDPMTLRANPLNFVYQIQEHMLEIRRRAPEFRYPYLLFYAQGDRIVNPEGAADFATRTRNNHPLNQVVSVPDTYTHELFRARPIVRERLLVIAEEWIETLVSEYGSETPMHGTP